VECRSGYKRVRLCVREDLYRALVIIEASEGLRRYRIIEEALSLWLEDRKRFTSGFRVLTISEDLYNQLASIGGGDVVSGIVRLLEAYQKHQLVVPSTQPQAWAQARAQVQARAQAQVQSQAESRESVGLDFLDDNPWVSIIRNRHTATSTPSGF
jgi:hypothetical protein